MRADFVPVKNYVLGRHYDLSVAFLNSKEMREVTWRTKRQRKVSNVLSFPLSKTSGEILICPSAAKPYSVEYLFIHGLLHLKGRRHSATMEREEEKLLKRFGYAKNRNGNRRRHVPHKGSHSSKTRR